VRHDRVAAKSDSRRVFAQTANGVVNVNSLYPILVIGITVLLLKFGADFISDLATIWDRFRKKPPHEQVFATKEEVERMEVRTRSEILALNERSEQRARENRDLIQEKITSMEKSIGEKISDNKTNNAEQFGQMRGELHAIRGTMQSLSNDIFRSVGRMEGAGGRVNAT
jgi:hypothetical protein